MHIKHQYHNDINLGMFDRDGNGVIDFNEFASLWQYVCDWQETFRRFDLDSSGTIDRNELKLGTNMYLYYFGCGVLKCFFQLNV